MTLQMRDRENFEKGRLEAKKQMIKNLLKMQMPEENILQIAECSKELLDEVRWPVKTI